MEVKPLDWLELNIGDLMEFEGGSQPDKSFFSPVIKPEHIRLIQIRDYKTDKYETFIPFKMARRFCDSDDIMIGRYGPPIFQILRGIAGAYNVALIKVIPNSKIVKKYAYYFLTQDKLFHFVDKLSQRSSGQTGVDLKALKEYPVYLPSTQNEQASIAEALSDADALIESLGKFIEKKRQIKQGAMQELLTGKKRLPGYSGEWVTISLGQIADIYQPQTISAKQFTDNGYPVYGANGVVGFYHTTNHQSWQVTVTCRGSTCGTVNKTVDMCWITGNAMVINCDSNQKIEKSFLYYQLSNQNLNDCITGTGQPQIVRTPLANFLIKLPVDKVEQQHIASILMDLDLELSEIESKLTKARQIKQGMMQELLTGRIRLV